VVIRPEIVFFQSLGRTKKRRPFSGPALRSVEYELGRKSFVPRVEALAGLKKGNLREAGRTAVLSLDAVRRPASLGSGRPRRR
jgi:hypothetical protein